jgi:hypothetical protein
MGFRFRHHVIDTDLPAAYFGQTVLADLDNDGRLEFILGRWNGEVYWYKCHAPDNWSRHLLATDSPSAVGGCALDVDGDGWLDYVAGGAWFRNSRRPDQPFARVVFDPALSDVHDLVAADIDGDGRPEILTMSDPNGLWWHKIADDPASLWPGHRISDPVHAGLSVGDLDGDGDLDVVRTTVWFENAAGDGSRWVEHPIGPSTPPPPDFQEPWARDATYSVVCDMNGDGRNDIVFCDAEIPGGRIWWMENLDGRGGRWRRHEVPNGDDRRRGPYHTLHVGDLDGDGDLDIFSCEMEAIPGAGPPRWYIWENVDGVGAEWKEHVILDAGLGGHQARVGDITGNGLPDIIGKPWFPRPTNSLGGRMFVVFLENISGSSA